MAIFPFVIASDAPNLSSVGLGVLDGPEFLQLRSLTWENVTI
ncbi:hypothetical protein [Aliiroseovarius sp.]|nr:hypothetical protein [Aliiroseovarius sp.]